MLIVIGSDDSIISVAQQVARMADLCAAGYTVELVECAGADHNQAQVEAGLYTLQWLRDRRAGTPIAADTCVAPTPVDCTTL